MTRGLSVAWAVRGVGGEARGARRLQLTVEGSVGSGSAPLGVEDQAPGYPRLLPLAVLVYSIPGGRSGRDYVDPWPPA